MSVSIQSKPGPRSSRQWGPRNEAADASSLIASRSDNVVKDTAGSSKENAVAFLENPHEHEQSEHPSEGAGNMRLETSVRFSGVVAFENEDLVAAARYWKSRQEHVEATDFYKFMSSNLRVGETAAIESPDILGQKSPPVVPPRPRKYAHPGATDGPPVVPSKDPFSPNQQNSPDPHILASKAIKRRPPPPPPKISNAVKLSQFPTRASAVVEANNDGSQDTLDLVAPHLANLNLESNGGEPPKIAQWANVDSRPISMASGSKEKTIGNFDPQKEKFPPLAPGSLQTVPSSDTTAPSHIDRTSQYSDVFDGTFSKPPLPPRTNVATASVIVSKEVQELRNTIAEMRHHGLGSRVSMQIGLKYVTEIWDTIPSRSVSANVAERHFKEIMNNFNKTDGKGLAELSQGFSLLHVFVRLQRLDLAQELIDQGAVLSDAPAGKSQSLLRNVVWYSETADMVKFLINNGDDINGKEHKDNIPPLHQAVAAYNFEAVKTLIEAGANVNATIRKFKRDIGMICRPKDIMRPERMIGILYLLLDAGSSIQLSEDGGYTPALFTGASGIESVLDILREKGADPDQILKLRDFSLSAAIIFNDFSMIRGHVAKGTDLNRRNIFRWRPLDFAEANKKDGKAAKILVAAGAKPASSKKAKENKQKTGADDEDDLRYVDSDTWSLEALEGDVGGTELKAP